MIKGIPRQHNTSLPHEHTTLSEEQKASIVSVALRRMVMIKGNVYGLEDPAEPEAHVNCAAMTEKCRAVCCTYLFALTQEEVRTGKYLYNRENPYYMQRDADGYCPYLDRVTFRCSIHETRPLRCRKYACPEDVCG